MQRGSLIPCHELLSGVAFRIARNIVGRTGPWFYTMFPTNSAKLPLKSQSLSHIGDWTRRHTSIVFLFFLSLIHNCSPGKTRTMETTPGGFTQRKARILSDLEVPDSSYTDASPKGSVDGGVRELISEINSHPGLVTTSSCAGRASVFLEGQKAPPTQAPDGTAPASPDGPLLRLAGEVGGKGGGGHWLYVSHDPFPAGEDGSWASLLFGYCRMARSADPVSPGIDLSSSSTRLIHFKFEPMVCPETTRTATLSSTSDVDTLAPRTRSKLRS